MLKYCLKKFFVMSVTASRIFCWSFFRESACICLSAFFLSRVFLSAAGTLGFSLVFFRSFKSEFFMLKSSNEPRCSRILSRKLCSIIFVINVLNL